MGPRVGKKGLYEVTTGTTPVFREPSAAGITLFTLKAGIRFHGTPVTFAPRRIWVKICTEDSAPPLLCLGREAGLGEEYPHLPEGGVPKFTLTLGNPVIERPKMSNLTDIQCVDTSKRFPVAGRILSISFMVSRPRIHPDLKFQVYRSVRANLFRLIDETPAIACPAVGVMHYALKRPLEVQRNDLFGWACKNSNSIPYTEGGSTIRWSHHCQGTGVTIDMSKRCERTFSYEVTYENSCPGHKHYKGSAPPPLHSDPDLGSAKQLWVQLDEKCINRIRDQERHSIQDVNMDEIIGHARNSPTKSDGFEAGLSTSLPPILSSVSSRSRMTTTDEWCKSGAGGWINFRHYGVHHSPPNNNCGRWRQLKF